VSRSETLSWAVLITAGWLLTLGVAVATWRADDGHPPAGTALVQEAAHEVSILLR
jgi:hypothetical protein